MLDLVFQGSAAVVGHVVTVDVTRVVTVLVKVMSEVLANMMIIMVIKDKVTFVGVLGHPLVQVRMSFVSLGIVFPIIWIMLNAVNIVVLVNMLWVVFAVVYI